MDFSCAPTLLALCIYVFFLVLISIKRALTSLVVKFEILHIDSWMVALSCVVVFSLIVTCNFCNTRGINR